MVTRRTSLAAVAGALLRGSAENVPRAQFDPVSRTWNIENDRIVALFRLDDQDRFRFVSLRSLADGHVWRSPGAEPSSPISFLAGGVNVTAETRFTLASQSTTGTARGGVRLTIQLEVREVPVSVRLELEVYPGQPFLRYRTAVENRAASPLAFTAADMLPWKFEVTGGLRGLFVGQWSWGGERANFEPHEVDFDTLQEPVEAFTGAYGNHSTWGAIRDSLDNGVVFGWEFDGRARAHAFHRRQDGIFETDAQVQQLNHSVAPGQEFQIPAAFAGLYRGDWDEAGYRTQRFVEAVLAAAVPGPGFPYVAFDSWGYQWAIDEATLRHAAERAAWLGVELFTVDFGWAAVTGDWHADPVKFPNGLRPLSDWVHSLGMKFGLHLPFAEAMAESQVLTEHPDWAVAVNPAQQRAYFGALGLCLSHLPAREWVISEIIRVVRQNGVDWLLQDGENMVKGCFAGYHTHDPGDSNYSNSVEGLNAVQEAVRRELPDLAWENCEDGGNMQTFNMVRNYVTSIVNDNSDFLVTRRSIHGATYPFPPRYTDRYMESTPWDIYRTRSHFFGGPLIVMDRITGWADWMADFMRREIAIYKSIRELIRDAKVYHLTPPPDGTFNDYIQSCQVETGRSVIFVYRQETPSASERVRPKGLLPGAFYRVRFQESARTLRAIGSELATTGIPVDLPTPWFAEIVYIDPE